MYSGAVANGKIVSKLVVNAKIFPNSLGVETCEIIALHIGPEIPLNMANPTPKYICHEYFAKPLINDSRNPDPKPRRHIADSDSFSDCESNFKEKISRKNKTKNSPS